MRYLKLLNFGELKEGLEYQGLPRFQRLYHHGSPGPRISTKLIDTAKTEVKIILQFCYLLSLFAK